jgi:exosortase H (IPTLxxWG-CTERM-specific)
VSHHRKNLRKKKASASLAAEWRAWYESKGPFLRFCLKFGVLMVLFYAFLATIYGDRLLYSYLELNAWVSNAILAGLGQNTHLSGLTIQSPKFAVTIERGCDAVEPTWLVCAAVLSFRSPWLHKLLGILAGIVLLQALNLIRIVTLYWIGLHWPGFFNSAHMEIWPVAFLLVAIVLFIGWREWTSNRQTPHAPA